MPPSPSRVRKRDIVAGIAKNAFSFTPVGAFSSFNTESAETDAKNPGLGRGETTDFHDKLRTDNDNTKAECSTRNDKIVKLQERLNFLNEENEKLRHDMAKNNRKVGESKRASMAYDYMKDEYN